MFAHPFACKLVLLPRKKLIGDVTSPALVRGNEAAGKRISCEIDTAGHISGSSFTEDTASWASSVGAPETEIGSEADQQDDSLDSPPHGPVDLTGVVRESGGFRGSDHSTPSPTALSVQILAEEGEGLPRAS